LNSAIFETGIVFQGSQYPV